MPKLNENGEHILTDEEYQGMIDDLAEANTRITELEAQVAEGVKPEAVGEEVERMTEQIRETEEELTEVRNELTVAKEQAEEVDTAIISLREDALDSFAEAAGLGKFDRETDEKYIAYKARVDGTDSIMSLIRTRRHYDIRSSVKTGERRSIRQTDEEETTDAPKPMHYSPSSALLNT